MVKIGLQLHTLRPLDESIERKLDRAVDAGYDGVQFTPDLGNSTPARLEEALGDRNLDVAGCHIDLHQLESHFDETLSWYRTIGTSALVVPSYDSEAFETIEGVEAAADHLSSVARRLQEDGFSLHYHNHYFEFSDIDGRSGYDLFLEAAEGTVLPEIDTGLAYHGGIDPVELIADHADTVDLLHLTDTIPGSNETAHTDLGAGEVPLQDCVDAAVDADVTWLIYENGRTDDPATSIVDAATEIESYLEA